MKIADSIGFKEKGRPSVAFSHSAVLKKNEEIHTIVIGGPMFKNSIRVSVGETIIRNGFTYADIIPE